MRWVRALVVAGLCVAPAGCVCRAQYLWDGRQPDGVARPYYKVEKCWGDKTPHVVCDSPTRLPNKGVCE